MAQNSEINNKSALLVNIVIDIVTQLLTTTTLTLENMTINPDLNDIISIEEEDYLKLLYAILLIKKYGTHLQQGGGGGRSITDIDGEIKNIQAQIDEAQIDEPESNTISQLQEKLNQLRREKVETMGDNRADNIKKEQTMRN